MNTNFLNSLTNFIRKRTFEFLGLILISTSIGLTIAFTTYSPEDPSFIYGDREFVIQNFFGIYGSSVADFLLQSFGLVSFLILINFFSWGINLLYKKEIKKIILKLFLIVVYLNLGTIFIYITFNNSFWLIDNGNSGFVGKIGYNFLSNWFPWIDNKFSIYGLLLITLILFVLSSDLNFKKLTIGIFSLFKKKGDNISKIDFDEHNIVEKNKIIEKPQQSFLFESNDNVKKEPNLSKSIYKLPAIEYLEKSLSKLSSSNFNKSRPNGEFMEKIFLVSMEK